MTVPELRTPRLRLRPLTAADLDGLLPIVTDPEVMRFIGGPCRDRVAARRWLDDRLSRGDTPGMGAWAVECLACGRIAGICCLWPSRPLPGGPPETGWIFDRGHWGQGYATEAARAVLRHGFDTLGLPEIWALIGPGNAASLAVAGRLGFRPAGEHRFAHGVIDRVLVVTHSAGLAHVSEAGP